MLKFYSILISGFLISSCTPSISYIGNSYDRTENVDVFVDESAIGKNYKIVGKGYVSTVFTSVPESIQTKAVKKARQKGADAVLIKDYYLPVGLPLANGSIRVDSLGRNVNYVRGQYLPLSSSSQIFVLFLKYQ